eukprot:TRINITY_DN60910_c0_g1_i1.p1 TRINITY_DN60910_c0_g1~~TRINITY_DN60910_c0_g1_i1.p1  ORF type:complete len:253 (-),score=35.69 TRINITY_DN60910_c0_g1_i1:170-928(-)
MGMAEGFVPGVGSAALVRQRSPRRAFGTGKDYEVGAELSASQIRFMELAKEFVETGTGFGSPARPELIADDFVFRGPIIGPLCKADYLETLNTNKVYEAFPDLASGAFGYTVDPKEPNRIWFFTRFTGTNTGPIRLGNFVELPPTGAEINGAPEVNSIMLDEHGRVKLFTVGYNVDRDAGTSGGAGALFGLLNGCGIPMPPGWLFSVGQWFGNLAADVFNNFAGSRTVSREEDLPAWYKSYCPTRRGSEGVY